MSQEPALHLNAAAAKSLAIWHEIVASRGMARLKEIVHPDAVFRSPMAHKPYKGAEALFAVLSAVMEVFENFRYHRTFVAEDGTSAALEFSAVVNGRELKGADFIAFDENGLITEFEVMVRPMSGLAALGEEMGKRVGMALAQFS